MKYANTSPPPRKLSLMSRLIILFGGFWAPFGWFFFGFGMIFVLVFVMNSEAVYWFYWSGWQETEAKVVEVRSTNSYVNDRVVMAFDVQYEVEGQQVESSFYSSRNYIETGETIAIEYAKGKPVEIRAEGFRGKPFPPFVIFIIVFPLIGLIFMVIGHKKNIKDLDLLVYGIFAEGKLMNKEATNTQINNQTVYKYTFAFTTKRGESQEVITKTHLFHKVEDEPLETIIYAEDDPSFATVYDSISVAPRIDGDGSFRPLPIIKAWVLIVPILTILMFGVYYGWFW